MTSGIHHVTSITRDVQANVDFWMGFLGFDLVKQTGGFEDAEQLHLFYGNPAGDPGTLVSFLVWQDGARGRVGHGQVTEIALAIPRARVGDWLTRAMQHGLRIEGPMREFGQTILRLRDPDGIIVKLVGIDADQGDWPQAPIAIQGVTLWSEKPDETAALVRRFGYHDGPAEGAVRRLIADTGFLDIRDASGFVPGIPGAGVIDHVALRMPDQTAIEGHRDWIKDQNLSETNIHDRLYFVSLYLREPGGTLLELATEGPGMSVDEQPGALGRTLFIPPHFAGRTDDLRVMLPQFARPGEERRPMRDLPFVHRFYQPEDPDGSVMLLLHGTGGNEADLMPLANRLAPRATLLGLRGRSTEEGSARFFRRTSMTTFDQDDIRSEAAAFAAFLDGAVAGYGLDADRITVLGYSNGANFAGAVMGLHPGLIRRAILIRPMAALEDLPAVDLAGARVLTLTGARDPYGAYAGRLNEWLAETGADLDAQTVAAGHELAQADLDAAQNWLRGA